MSKRMRVLLLATDAYGGHGGIAYYNRCLAEALASQQNVEEVILVLRQFQSKAEKVPQKIRLVKSGTGGKLRYLITTFVQSLSRSDMVICGHINLLPLAAVVAKFKRVPLVLQVHGIDAWSPVPSAIRWLAGINAIWSVSTVTRDRMNAWARLPISKYTIIPNTIHQERYGVAPKRTDLLERYGIQDCKVIVSMGRLASSERYKGFDEIMEAMPSLREHVPNIVYLILGDGDDKARLESKAKALGIDALVHFAGYIGDEEKADYLRLADVFAMPGRGEGFGIVFLEAMACGIPVVGSQLDGSRDALRDGALGELVNPDDPASLINGILNALKKQRQVDAGLKFFSWEYFERRVGDSIVDVMKNNNTLDAYEPKGGK